MPKKKNRNMKYTWKAISYLYRLYTPTYFVYWLGSILSMLLCYLTNPIVVLFCNKYGQLPKIFKLWETYDNCLDVEWMVTEKKVPRIFQYDFNKHYIYHPEIKQEDIFTLGYVELLDGNFTIKERIQRYFCRVAWLYRNCAYGFAYYLFGIRYFGSLQTVLENQKKDDGSYVFVSTYQRNNKTYFCIKVNEYWKLFGYPFKCDIYLGWKMAGTITYNSFTRAMTAIRISPFQKA